MVNDGQISLPIYDYLHYNKIFDDLDRQKRMEMLHLLNRFGESIVDFEWLLAKERLSGKLLWQTAWLASLWRSRCSSTLWYGVALAPALQVCPPPTTNKPSTNGILPGRRYAINLLQSRRWHVRKTTSLLIILQTTRVHFGSYNYYQIMIFPNRSYWRQSDSCCRSAIKASIICRLPFYASFMIWLVFLNSCSNSQIELLSL